jgi:hypothetical protein
VGPKPVSSKAKKSSTKGRHSEDLEYIPKPGEVVEGFDDTDETNLDLEDELVPLSIDEVLVLPCISFRGGGCGGGVGSHAMLYYLDINGICTCLRRKFVSAILVSGSKKP